MPDRLRRYAAGETETGSFRELILDGESWRLRLTATLFRVTHDERGIPASNRSRSMDAASAPEASGTLTQDRLRRTPPYRRMLLPRIIAGVPLFGIGLAHVFIPEAAMRPMVEAAGFPFPAVVAPVGVAVQIVAGFSLLAGWWARIGAFLGVLSMLGAIYAHIVIDVWPGEGATGPPDALPITVLAGCLYVLWRGAGRWSLDRRAVGSRTE
jgi:putative oxidoreductase